METCTVTCPGCHFGCVLDHYECARGLRWYEKWLAGEEVPERRGPGGPPNMTPDQQILMALNMHEGFATPHVAAERSHLSEEEFNATVESLITQKLVVYGYDELDREFLMLTSEGKQQAPAPQGPRGPRG